MMEKSDIPSTVEVPVQVRIESIMKDYVEEERWKSIFLFSSEGLLMASYGISQIYNEEKLLEFSFSLIDTVKLLGNEPSVKEIIIRGKEKKILIFRYFHALEDDLVIAAVISGKKGYRRALSKVIKLICSL